jgi:hypothetical protein
MNTREQKISNTATQVLKQLLKSNKNDCIQTFSLGLTPTESANYSQWKVTKKIKRSRNFLHHLGHIKELGAGSNVEKEHAFAEHLAKVSQSHPLEIEHEEEEALMQLLETPYQFEPPINQLKRAEVQEVINSLNPKNHHVTTSSLATFLKNYLSLQ